MLGRLNTKVHIFHGSPSHPHCGVAAGQNHRHASLAGTKNTFLPEKYGALGVYHVRACAGRCAGERVRARMRIRALADRKPGESELILYVKEIYMSKLK